jgi:hypothetical protein
MAPTVGGPLMITDSDVDELAAQFMHSGFAEDTYADWSLEQRLDGFLRHRGLVRLTEDGDAYDLILNRVMAHIGALHRRQ